MLKLIQLQFMAGFFTLFGIHGFAYRIVPKRWILISNFCLALKNRTDVLMQGFLFIC